ncbi:MAG: acyl-CoA dehydrogenase family protein [Solirubrobacteraceae bacterium]
MTTAILEPHPFAGTDERAAFVEALRDFCARECGTRAQRDALTGEDHLDTHSQPLYEKLADLGWIGCGIPEEYGGAGGSITDVCLMLEETARGMLPIYGVGTSLISAHSIERFGSEEQKREILGGACRGDVLSIAMSEPEAGSDVAALRCRAERVAGGYLVNGQKTWISNAHHAARTIVICRTDRSGASKHEGVSMLDVPAGTEGMIIQPIPTMAGREVNDVFFEDCFVSDDALIGVEGAGWKQLMAGLNFERLVTAAIILGAGQRAFDDALQFVKEREQFGKPIGSFQTIKHRIADLATELECCRLLTYDVARKADQRPDVQMPREASMAKLKITETAKQVAIEGMQMMGGYGYATEYDMEHHLRTLIVSTVYAGTSEIQREIIGKTFGL